MRGASVKVSRKHSSKIWSKDDIGLQAMEPATAKEMSRNVAFLTVNQNVSTPSDLELLESTYVDSVPGTFPT